MRLATKGKEDEVVKEKRGFQEVSNACYRFVLKEGWSVREGVCEV
jgi:hypothetical protein